MVLVVLLDQEVLVDQVVLGVQGDLEDQVGLQCLVIQVIRAVLKDQVVLMVLGDLGDLAVLEDHKDP